MFGELKQFLGKKSGNLTAEEWQGFFEEKEVSYFMCTTSYFFISRKSSKIRFQLKRIGNIAKETRRNIEATLAVCGLLSTR
jgi:hypothetical protein